MHEVCDLVYKLWYSLRQCLCGELRESARSRCRNQMNAKRKLQTSCKSNSRPEIIPVLPSVKAEHRKKKKKELSGIYISPSKLRLIANKGENASPSPGSGGGWSRAMEVGRGQAAPGTVVWLLLSGRDVANEGGDAQCLSSEVL